MEYTNMNVSSSADSSAYNNQNQQSIYNAHQSSVNIAIREENLYYSNDSANNNNSNNNELLCGNSNPNNSMYFSTNVGYNNKEGEINANNKYNNSNLNSNNNSKNIYNNNNVYDSNNEGEMYHNSVQNYSNNNMHTSAHSHAYNNNSNRNLHPLNIDNSNMEQAMNNSNMNNMNKLSYANNVYANMNSGNNNNNNPYSSIIPGYMPSNAEINSQAMYNQNMLLIPPNSAPSSMNNSGLEKKRKSFVKRKKIDNFKRPKAIGKNAGGGGGGIPQLTDPNNMLLTYKKKRMNKFGGNGKVEFKGYESLSSENKILFDQVRDITIYELQNYKNFAKSTSAKKKKKKILNNANNANGEGIGDEVGNQKNIGENLEGKISKSGDEKKNNKLNVQVVCEKVNKEEEDVVMSDSNFNLENKAATEDKNSGKIKAETEEPYKLGLAALGQICSIQMLFKKITFKNKKLVNVISTYPDVFTILKQTIGGEESNQIDILLNEPYRKMRVDICDEVKEFTGILMKNNNAEKVKQGERNDVGEQLAEVSPAGREAGGMIACDTAGKSFKKSKGKKRKKDKLNAKNNNNEENEKQINQKSANNANDILFESIKNVLIHILKTDFKEENNSASFTEIGKHAEMKNLVDTNTSIKTKKISAVCKLFPECFSLTQIKRTNKLGNEYILDGVQLTEGMNEMCANINMHNENQCISANNYECIKEDNICSS